MEKGYVHVYTGNGKGKTTAALGLAVRACCAGKRVFFAQFIKGMEYSELAAPRYLPGLTIQQFGRGCFIYQNPTEDDVRAAQAGLRECRGILAAGTYDLVVLDEINIALYYRLFPVGDVLAMLDQRQGQVEVVLTGRYAPPEVIARADLVTEMREIKHYYTQGVLARTGIEK